MKRETQNFHFITVCGYKFEIIWASAQEMEPYGAWGLCDGDKNRIYLCIELNNQQLARVTIHEILRAINYITVKSKKSTECEDVERTAKAFAMVLRDNFEIFIWINSLLNNDKQQKSSS